MWIVCHLLRLCSFDSTKNLTNKFQYSITSRGDSSLYIYVLVLGCPTRVYHVVVFT